MKIVEPDTLKNTIEMNSPLITQEKPEGKRKKSHSSRSLGTTCKNSQGLICNNTDNEITEGLFTLPPYSCSLSFEKTLVNETPSFPTCSIIQYKNYLFHNDKAKLSLSKIDISPSSKTKPLYLDTLPPHSPHQSFTFYRNSSTTSSFSTSLSLYPNQLHLCTLRHCMHVPLPQENILGFTLYTPSGTTTCLSSSPFLFVQKQKKCIEFITKPKQATHYIPFPALSPSSKGPFFFLHPRETKTMSFNFTLQINPNQSPEILNKVDIAPITLNDLDAYDLKAVYPFLDRLKNFVFQHTLFHIDSTMETVIRSPLRHYELLHRVTEGKSTLQLKELVNINKGPSFSASVSQEEWQLIQKDSSLLKSGLSAKGMTKEDDTTGGTKEMKARGGLDDGAVTLAWWKSPFVCYTGLAVLLLVVVGVFYFLRKKMKEKEEQKEDTSSVHS